MALKPHPRYPLLVIFVVSTLLAGTIPSQSAGGGFEKIHLRNAGNAPLADHLRTNTIRRTELRRELDKDRARDTFRRLPLQFERNMGQAAPRFSFLSRMPGYSLSLSAAEAVFVFRKAPTGIKGSETINKTLLQKVTMKLVGANPSSLAEGQDSLPGRVNYLLGKDMKKHRKDIPTYGRVKFTGVYSGIDLMYYGKQRQLEYDFLVAPGANTDLISLQFEGSDQIDIREEGVVVTVGGNSLRLENPFVYQEVNGKRVEISSGYLFKGQGRVGFRIGEYDHNRPLVIDPVLSYSSFLGGSGAEFGNDIKLDTSGNIYVTGFTTSPEFPKTDNSVPKGSFDVYISKLNPSGTAFIFSTFFGGSGADNGLSLGFDGNNNIYVSGLTESTDYPTTSGAFQVSAPGVQAALLTKLNPAGNTILYSTYLGGAGLNNGARITVDASGDVYLTGSTYSDTFPTTSNAFQSSMSPASSPGATESFIAKLHPAGAGPADLVYSTYLGGNELEMGKDIALDAAGFVYLFGWTQSANFPTTPGSFQPTHRGGDDAYLVKMDLRASGAASLIYSTYIGGSGNDTPGGIAIDAANAVYLTGRTNSSDFPVSRSALQRSLAGGTDAYVMKLNLSLAGAGAQVYSTYLGGSADENSFGSDLAVDRVGNVYMTGDTRSTNLPVTVGAFQPSIGGISDAFSAPGGDAFAAKLNAAGTALVYFTYLGGSEGDGGSAIAIDSDGNACLTGYTFSPNFPLTANALQTTQGGQFDAFVSCIDNPSSFPRSGNISTGKVSEISEATNTLPNPIDEAQKFVRQQYLDFLSREPDASGLAFWTNEINSCGTDAACISLKRTNVSAAFFLSIEFQQTGYLVDRLYLASFARPPRLREFFPDSRLISEGVIVNSLGWEQVLENNTQSFTQVFVSRPEFLATYPTTMSADEFVTKLNTTAGGVISASEEAQLISGLGATPSDTAKRASVLRSIAENSVLKNRERNKAFVLMQYLGYLHRNPDDPPDTNDSGYNFWLTKLNQFNGDFVAAEMVKAFITSGEYRTRFGQN